MIPSIRLAALALCATALGGCAASHASFAGQFVKQGEPAVDLGGPPVAEMSRPAPEAPGGMPSMPAVEPKAAGTTIESSDAQLAAALLLEQLLPTAANHVAAAREYMRLGILDTAFTHANQALTVDPACADAHELIARIWRDWRFPARGLGAAHRAVYYNPRSASAENTLGTLLDAIGRPDLARAAYDRAVAFDPKAAWALSNACYSEFRLGHLALARARCEAALAIDPGLRAAHNNLALAFAAGGDLRRAAREFLAAGDPATAEYNLGIVYLAGGDNAAAADQFERALKARPDFAEARSRAQAARMRQLTGGQN